MGNIKVKIHLKAAVELLELMSIASLIALIGDGIWIIRDIIVNGPTPCLLFIGVLLWLSVAMMSIGVYKYHVKAVKKLIHELVDAKIRARKQEIRLARRLSK